MSFAPNELVATNASSTQVSCSISNSNGCNFSVDTGGATLNATMTQDLSTSGSPQFNEVTATTSATVGSGADSMSVTNPGSGQGALNFANGQARILYDGTIFRIEPYDGKTGPSDAVDIAYNGVTTNPGVIFNVQGSNDSLNTTSGCAVYSGGLGIGKNVNIGLSGGLTVFAHTASTSPTTGCATFAGGVGVIGDINNGGNLNVSGNTTISGTLRVSAITSTGSTTVDGQLVAAATTDATSTSTGALVTPGGMGIAKNAYVGGQIRSTSSTDSSSTSTGAIVTPGGVGVGGHIFCGSGINFGGSTLSNFTNTSPWTPTLSSGGNTAGFGYSNQTGNYCQIGPLVMCNFSINLTSKGSTSGNITINLPVTNSANVSQPTMALGAWGLVGLNTGYTQLSISVNPNSTYANIDQSSGTSNSYDNLTLANLTASSGLWGNFWYFV